MLSRFLTNLTVGERTVCVCQVLPHTGLISLSKLAKTSIIWRGVSSFREAMQWSRLIVAMEDQLGALSPVLNVVVRWTTRYTEAALAHPRQQREAAATIDVERLSPLGSAHINLLGRSSFTPAESLTRGEVRPRQDPAALLQPEL